MLDRTISLDRAISCNLMLMSLLLLSLLFIGLFVEPSTGIILFDWITPTLAAQVLLQIVLIKNKGRKQRNIFKKHWSKDTVSFITSGST